MEIKLAKSAGFCFGVKRAVDMVYEQAQKREERLDAVEKIGRASCRERVCQYV